ncbi:unnamed protein product [Cylicostephanus goldi]|uniref:Uncharacterized protein n=1 Tax=Cylicostephanus goldi TaxID=71465 RepID=A0A3P6S3M4_CYLGO|nr:unnamed protein product [Cylicostephanus goldi]
MTTKVALSFSRTLVGNDRFSGDDLATMLSSSALDGCANQGDVESLLGPGFRPQLPSQPLQQVDLSFVDSYSNPAFYHHE